MSPFDEGFDWIVQAEGGYTDHPQDPGGPTGIAGVSLKAVRLRDVDRDGKLDFDLDRDGDVDAEDMKLVTVEHAKQLYQDDYWSLAGAGEKHKLSCDSLPRRWSIAVFDSAVLQGPRTAVALLQRAVGVKDDGILGPKTVDAVWALKTEFATLARFSAKRLARLRLHPDVATFFEGWAWRLSLLQSKLGRL